VDCTPSNHLLQYWAVVVLVLVLCHLAQASSVVLVMLCFWHKLSQGSSNSF
jgi:hypothetical protein